MKKHVFGRTYGRVFDFSFGGRTENRHQMALALFSGADVEARSPPIFEPGPLKGVLGPSLPGKRRNTETEI